jgi:hypothetical protein
VEENRCPILELRAVDPFRRQTHPFSKKGKRPVKIADGQRENFDARLHGCLLVFHEECCPDKMLAPARWLLKLNPT